MQRADTICGGVKDQTHRLDPASQMLYYRPTANPSPQAFFSALHPPLFILSPSCQPQLPVQLRFVLLWPLCPRRKGWGDPEPILGSEVMFPEAGGEVFVMLKPLPPSPLLDFCWREVWLRGLELFHLNPPFGSPWNGP